MLLSQSVLYSFIIMSFIFSKSVAFSTFRRSYKTSPVSVILSRQFSSSGAADTVVATCTKKIKDLLNPVKLKVTSSNDDPNGSHVSQ